MKQSINTGPGSDKKRKLPVVLRFVFLPLLTLLSASSLANPSVTVQQGTMSGLELTDTHAYLGVPYAAPPVGANRWRAPAAPAPFGDVFQTTTFGAPCPQKGTAYASNDPAAFGTDLGSEDCLALNVWRPKTQSAEPRDVLVFLHGGGGTVGSSSLPLYDGAHMAQALDAVVVTVNFRLGVFGALHHAGLQTGDPATDSGNFTLLDILAGLDWVQNNIAYFGGDAGSVTLMGQSAGGISLWALLRSPLASGRFQRAVSMSAVPAGNTQQEVDERTRQLVYNLMRIDDPTLTQSAFDSYYQQAADSEIATYLAGKNTEELLAGAEGDPGNDDDDVGYRFHAEDGYVLPAESGNGAADYINAVPMMMGQAENEASMLLFSGYSHLSESQLFDLNNSGLAWPTIDRRDLIESNYLGYRLTVGLGNITVDGILADTANSFASTGEPIFRYQFNWDDFPNPWRRVFGAYHGLDLPFMFGNFQDQSDHLGRFALTAGTAAYRRQLSDHMLLSLKGFMHSGDPNALLSASPWSDSAFSKYVIE